jgi:hypothetical protein
MNTINDKIKKLVDRKIGGTLRKEDQRELDKILSSSGAARTYLERMESLHRSLEAAGKEKETVDISREVMERVRRLHAGKPPGGTFRITPRIHAFNRQSMRYAAVLLAGLLLGSAATYTIYSGGRDIGRDRARATMSGSQGLAMDASGDTWQVFTQPLAMDGLSLLVVSLKTREEATVRIRFDHNALRLESTRFLRGGDAATSRAAAGQLVVESAGDVVFQMVCRPLSERKTSLSLSLEQGGQFVHQREIPF